MAPPTSDTAAPTAMIATPYAGYPMSSPTARVTAPRAAIAKPKPTSTDHFMPLIVGAFRVSGVVCLAERVVKVRLAAVVEGFKKDMLEAAEAVRTVGSQEQRIAQTRQAMQTLGAAGIAMGAALAAGIGVAVAKYAEFDQQMSFVAATGEDARGSLDALRQAALDAGADTVFSATEAAKAIEEMAKAGLSAKDILSGGLTGALDLAAAGGLEVADAAGIAATALKIFNLEGSDMSHVADLLAAGAGKAMGDVSDLSAALNQAGLVANSTGLSIEETTAGLAAFASQGLLGSDAGTSFKTMLGALTPNSAKAADEMKRLGISAYDSQGRFIGLAEFAGNLKDSLSGLTDEQRNASLEIMFGSDAVRAANVLYSEGAEGIEQWTNKVNDSGYAAETAATRLDNLMGDWEKLTGALDTAFITMGEGADGPLRFLIQRLTELVDGFTQLPDWAQQAGLGVAALAAGVGLVGGAALLAIPQIAAFKVALIELGLSAARADRLMGLLGRAAGVAGVVGVFALATTAANELGNALADAIGPSAAEVASKISLAKSGVELFYAALQKRDAPIESLEATVPLFEKVGGALDDASDQAKEWWNAIAPANRDTLSTIFTIGQELENLAKTDFSAAADQFRTFADDADLSKEQIVQLMKEMPGFRDQVIKAAEAVGIASDDQSLLNFILDETPAATAAGAEGMSELETAAIDADEALANMAQALEDVARGALDLGSAKDSALSAINAMIDAANAEGAAIDGSNDASIRLRDSVREVEEAHRASAQAILENGGTLEEAQAAWANGRQAVIDMLVAKGMDAAQAAVWADANLGSAQQVTDAMAGVKSAVEQIPPKRNIQLTVDTSEALRNIDQFVTQQSNNRVIRVRVAADGGSIQMGSINVSPNATGGLYSKGVKEFAAGEFLPGIYPATPGGIHRFAEAGYDEMYGTTDPKYAKRTYGIWTEFGNRMGFSQPQQGPVQVSLAGAEFTMLVDGNPVRAIVQEQIVGYDNSRSQTTRRGVRTV